MEKMNDSSFFIKKIFNENGESNNEKQLQLVEKCQNLIHKILSWAEKSGVEIVDMKKLGGGFVNPVLMVETNDGRSFVVKGFVKSEEAQTSKTAQVLFDQISKEDEKFIPEVVSWIDNETLISEKADGEPMRKKLQRFANGEISIEETSHHIQLLGRLLGTLHERTEQSAGHYEKEEHLRDRTKIKEHMSKYIPDVIDISFPIERLEEIIDGATAPDYVSLIHGDAHLEQFFSAPDESVVTIVDYDSLTQGDPMADIARSLSSLRSWTQRIGISQEDEHVLTQSLVQGYRSTRIEQPNPKESEFDYQKIVYLIEMKMFDDVRKKLKESLGIIGETLKIEIASEKDLYLAHRSEKFNADDLNQCNFDSSEIQEIKYLLDVVRNAQECVEYLASVDKI